MGKPLPLVSLAEPDTEPLRAKSYRNDAVGAATHSRLPFSMIFRRLFALGLVAIYLPSPAEETVSFARDIRPILNAKCTGCHGGVKQAGGVSFVYEDQVINFEGETGNPVVVPRDADVSELFFRITLPADDLDRMPPADEHPKGLSESEIDLIKRWIEQGAEWSEHWSFETPQRPKIPELESAATPIDQFVHARLQKEGLSPASPAEPAPLLRRLSLDLTGLPPSLEELDQFLEDHTKDPEKAIAAKVDELLARPAFGEKWSSMWLDLVRYADSRGLGQDGKRNIWPYRDWVVSAFNEDMPFDQFTIRQLAGDLLPDPTLNDLIATAAHRNTQTNNEGGTDDEEFRIEAVIDRVNTTWQTWGSITFGCVQCHDHPYEAFHHDDYYEFMAFFNNTADSDLNNDEPLLRVPNDPQQFETAARLDKEIRSLQVELWKRGREVTGAVPWKPLPLEGATTSNNTKLEIESRGGQDFFRTVGTVQRGPVYELTSPQAKRAQPITGLKLTVTPANPDKALKDSEWGFDISDLTVEIVGADKKATAIPFAASVIDVPYLPHSHDTTVGASGKGFRAWTRIHHDRELVIIPKNSIELGEQTLRIRISNKAYMLGAFPLVVKRGTFHYSTAPELLEFGSDPERLEGVRQLAKFQADRKAIPSSTLPVMAERPASIARPTHVFARGNFLEKDKLVTVGLPDSLPELPNKDSATRLDMAKWWVSGENPLTARVFVNRLWEQLFGTGLVATLEDFGSSGEKPSHPALLDYLALRFEEDYQWSIKSTLREIVLSSTYRQSSKASPDAIERDPANRLLARGPRNRLPAEVLRDQALAIAGLLTEKVGGPPVHPPIPQGVWKPFQGGDKWATPKAGQENRYRRALYTYTKRSIPYPTMATFDAPSREFCSPRRLVSNTPLQALTMLNDEAFAEAAQGLARRMKYDIEGTVAEKLATGYRIATARPPTQERLDELVGLYDKLEAQYQSEPKLMAGMAGTPDGAAFTIVAQVILNLDEVLTK